MITGNTTGITVQAGAIHELHVHRPAAAPTALRQLPARTIGFTGRARELDTIVTALDPDSDSTPPVLVVAGVAGVGKTALMVEAAHAAAERGWFPGGVLFLDLRGYDDTPVDAPEALDALLRALGIPGDHIPATLAQRVGLFRSTLADRRARTLLVADNAATAAQITPLLPADSGHRVLVTSRHTLAQLTARLLNLDVLTSGEAFTLLATRLRSADPDDRRITAEPAAADEIARCCGFLPLALQISAALLAADPGRPVAELAEQLADRQRRLDHLDDGERTVRSAFDLSYQRLPPDQARLFRRLALNPGPDLAIEAAVALGAADEPAVRHMLAELVRAHLLERAPVRGRWRMHDLIRRYAEEVLARQDTARTRDKAIDRLLGVYWVIAMAADAPLRASRDSPVRAPERFADPAAAVAWFDAERANLIAATSLAAATGRDQIAGELPARMAEYLDWRGRVDDKIALERIAITAARRRHDRGREAAALTRIGVALGIAGRVEEAVDAHRQAVDIFHAIGERRGEATALLNLGTAARRLRRAEDVGTAYRRALDIIHTIGDPHDTGLMLMTFGGFQSDAGDFDGAIPTLQQAVEILCEFGDQDGAAQALGCLGIALRDAGRLDEAIVAGERDVAICRETGNRRAEGKALNSLANTLAAARRFPAAAAHWQAAAEIHREMGDEHNERTALRNLDTARRAQRPDG